MSAYCENPVEALRLQKTEGLRIQPHLHTSAELIYIEKGEAALNTGTLEYKLMTGDFAFIMPSMLHSITPSDDDAVIYIINCKTELIQDVIKRLNGLRPASPVLKSANVPSQLLFALHALSTERDKNIAHSWINLIINIVASKLRFAEIHDGVTSDLSNRVLTYLSIHYREQISLEQLSDAMGVSRFHLSHLFSNKLGIGFKEYLNNLKVECAKTLLRTTDTPVSEIYSEAGFENQRTFNRVFRENTGSSPRNYRLGRDEFVTPPTKPTPVTIDDMDRISDIPDSVSASDIVEVYDETQVMIDPPAPVKPKRKRSSKKKLADEPTKPSQISSAEEAGLSQEQTDAHEIPATKKKKKEQVWLY